MTFRKMLPAAVVGALVIGSAAAGPAHSAPLPTGSCTVAKPDLRQLGAGLTADGGPAYAEWLELERNRTANLAIQQASNAEFGIDAGKHRISTLVRKGIIGSAIDHNTRTAVVVITPEYGANAAQLRKRLVSATAGLSLVPHDIKSDVRIGCYSGARLAAADELLSGRAWHPDAAKATFGYRLDATDSKMHVSFDPRFAAAAEAARAALGDVAVVRLDGASRLGRLDDGRPHFGGSGVRVGSGGINTNYCTTTFTVRRNSDGLRGGLSAGHCFGNGQPIFSSTRFWGDSWGRNNYPAFDMIGVASAGETYDNVIHVDPCCPTQRNVTARRTPQAGDTGVCLSGMTTRAICGLRVIDLTGHVCDIDGCTYGLMSAQRNGDIVARRGDSGGPVYIRSGSSNATGLGLIVGSPDGGVTVVAERMHVIESHLGVTVLTS